MKKEKKTEKKKEKKEVIEEIKEKKKKKKAKRSKKYGIHVKAKKKTAVARATIKRGSGKIKINKKLLSLIKPKYLNEFISLLDTETSWSTSGNCEYK